MVAKQEVNRPLCPAVHLLSHRSPSVRERHTETWLLK